MKRADEALVATGLAETLSIARALIMEGRVLCGSTRIQKPSELIKDAGQIRIKGQVDAYVSRGAHKLNRAFEIFDIDPKGKTCIDVGASTGGFTDVMLRRGAAKVYSVDVGYNLLDWKIRSDPRVVCMEKTNARFLKPEMFNEAISFGATDVSFISLKAILPTVFEVLAEGADFVALIKPQFEAAKEDVGEKGVVRDENVHIQVIKDIVHFCRGSSIGAVALGYSPIRGPEGNIEFLLHTRKAPVPNLVNDDIITETVQNAHVNFAK